MRIALFTDTFDEINGVANTFKRLVEYSKKKREKLEVFTLAKENGTERISKNIIIHRFKPRLPFTLYQENKFDLRFLNQEIISYFKREKFDLIHTATPGSMGINALFISRWFNIPIVGSYHTHLPEYIGVMVGKIASRIKWFDKKIGKKYENLTWMYMKWYYNQCKLVLAPSAYTRNQLRRRLKTKISIFSRGVDTRLFRPRLRHSLRKRLWRDTKIKALYVGRVSVEKRLDVLIKCFKDRNDAKLVIVGEGPYLAKLKKKISNAEFPGYLTGKELAKAYSACDFFLFPSTTDSFGNVVLEAMASGLPVIVSDKMGPKEIVRNGKDGFVTGLAGFYSKVDELIKNKKLRRKMGKEARKSAKKRSWDKVFGKLFEDYDSVAIKG